MMCVQITSIKQSLTLNHNVELKFHVYPLFSTLLSLANTFPEQRLLVLLQEGSMAAYLRPNTRNYPNYTTTPITRPPLSLKIGIEHIMLVALCSGDKL